MDTYTEPEEVENFLGQFKPGFGLFGWKDFFLVPTGIEPTDNGLTMHELWILASYATKEYRENGQTFVDYTCEASLPEGPLQVRIRLYVLDILGEVGKPIYQTHLCTRSGGRGMGISLWYERRGGRLLTGIQQFAKQTA